MGCGDVSLKYHFLIYEVVRSKTEPTTALTPTPEVRALSFPFSRLPSPQFLPKAPQILVIYQRW